MATSNIPWLAPGAPTDPLSSVFPTPAPVLGPPGPTNPNWQVKPPVTSPTTPNSSSPKPSNDEPKKATPPKAPVAGDLASTTTVPTGRKLHRNPPFSDNITRLYDLNTGGKFNLQRGFIKTDENALPGGSGDIFYLFFLYNPSTISISHSVDIERPAFGTPGDTATNDLLPMSQRLSFSLLFDRTYDVMKQTPLSGREGVTMNDMGVHADVLTLYDMLGITRQTNFLPTGKTVKDSTDDTSYSDSVVNQSSGTYNNRAVGPMLYTTIRCYFGKGLVYKAVVQSADIEYTHWTARMVPNRCTINISADLLPDTVANVGQAEVVNDVLHAGRTFNAALPFLYGNPISIRNGVPSYGRGGGGVTIDG